MRRFLVILACVLLLVSVLGESITSVEAEDLAPLSLNFFDAANQSHQKPDLEKFHGD